jgi:3-deoxy-D-manno-octulosonic-acid transferase
LLPYLLNLVYLLLILLSLPWLVWQSVRKGKYREGYAAKFLGLVPRRADSKKKCLWLHAVSVGEVNLLAPLLKAIEQERPDWECVISTTTTTGMALAKKKYTRQTVFYCPLDFSWAVAAAMRRVRPDVLVLAELELWPNLIRAARRRGAKVAVINGRLGEKSFRGYRRIRPLVARVLQQIDVIAAQDETCAERFLALGARPETVHVTGSMKYDGAQTDRNNPATKRLAALAGFKGDSPIFVDTKIGTVPSSNDIVLLAGSTQEPEEAMALETFRDLSTQYPRLRLIIVPRHPDRFDTVAKLLDTSGIPWQRRTALDPNHQITKSPNLQIPPRILLVDVVGELGAWWGTAQIAYVGGSMGSRGGQNMIEPAAYGAAVSFGPNTWNFRDIVAAVLKHDAAVVVNDGREFTQFVRRCFEDPPFAAALGSRAQSFVQSQLGATQRTLRLVAELV